MNIVLLAYIVFIVAALASGIGMLVWPGINHVPNWVVWTSMAIIAMGGGAAINLILYGVPK